MASSPTAPDRIAVALYRKGAVQPALEVAQLAMARNDARRIECRVAYDRMRRGESPDDGREVPDLDLGLVGQLLDLGRLFEARAVLQGAQIEGVVAARVIATMETALAPFPAEADPSFAAVLQLVRGGQAASAVRALDEVVTSSVPPPWLAERHAALVSLVRGTWREEAEPLGEVTRDTVLAKVRARDLMAALGAAKAAGAAALADVLHRLMAGTERILEATPEGDDDPETSRMTGHRLAEFHVRMGVLANADRDYRGLLKTNPDDDRARAMLSDVIALRKALGEEPEPLPPRAAVPMDTLRKNAPREDTKGGWKTGGRYAPIEDTPEGDESTARVSAADEAELLLKLGKSEQALDIFRILAIRHPKQQQFRRRIAEIEALIAQRMTPMASEATVRRDLAALSAKAVPTNPNIAVPGRAHPKFDDEEGDPTYVDESPLDDD